MKQLFVERRFSLESQTLLEKIASVLRDYASQGYDLSLRQLYYQLVAANVVENTERSYKNIGNLVSDARLAGLIDWDAIKDRGRECVTPAHWESPAAILKAVAAGFKINKWETQPCYVEVMVEKQALEGVLEPVCEELDIPFTANKGYSSSSAMYEAGRRMSEKVNDGKDVHVVYLGDHDPSGIDMTRDIEARLAMFSESEITVHRIALNMDQIRRLSPPRNPAKLTDSRAESYIARFGTSSWELDAIEPRALASMVRETVIKLRDEDEWTDALTREKKMRAELEAFAKKSKFNP